MSQEQRFKEFQSHFSDKISAELETFVLDQALLTSRYIFVRRANSTIQYGLCTHCKQDHVIKSNKTLKHNEFWQCDKCKSLVQVKQAGRGRGALIDTAYVVWYEKSHVDPLSIIASGYRVSRDYREKMEGVTTFSAVSRYLFEIGRATFMHRDHYYTGSFYTKKLLYGDGWSFAKEPWSMMGKQYYTRDSYQSMESIETAVNATQFRYSTWEKFKDGNRDMIFFFSTFSKYPFIEYLNKMGMYDIVRCMVDRGDLHNSINKRGKTPQKILGLSKKELKDWKASGIEMTPLILRTYKWFRERNVQISWNTSASSGQLLSGTYYMDRLKYIQEFASLDRIIRYVSNQITKDKKRHSNITNTISTWKDYLEHCVELQMDMSQERVLYPNSLHDEHQKMIRSIKMKNDEVLNQKIARLQPSFLKYRFEKNGLLIRPAASSIEMFDEGAELEHCVGRYAGSYAEGKIIIMFIRQIDMPDKSFYTLELDLQSGNITQCRGLKNCNMTPEVETFIGEYKLVLKDTKKKNKPSKRQGVAV